MESIMDLTVWQLLAAYVFIAVLAAILKAKGISREKIILLATVRMSLQLVFIAYVLVYVFQVRHPAYTVLLVGLMEGFAIYTIITRINIPLRNEMKRVIIFSMLSGSLISIVYFMLIVLKLTPWFEPRYFIPIAGMIIGNSMTGISLGINRLVDDMTTRREQVECALMLGATPQSAARPSINRAFDAAIMPTLNSMLGMGVIFLPGMMTGQILSGTSPIVSIEYQIVTMLGITGSVALTVFMGVHWGYKTFFNRKDQLL
jgi:putative ABC transport system permease protein